MPGGSCYGVGAGGHISGGGYGVLSRLHGLTVDWLSAVDILTVDAKGNVEQRRVDSKHEPDLFRACCGAGGNNFGLITAYYFDKMPVAPREVMNVSMVFPLGGHDTRAIRGHPHHLRPLLETRGKDPDTWGMFTFLGLSHRSGGRIGISAQFCNPDGTCNDLAPSTSSLISSSHVNQSSPERADRMLGHSDKAGTARIVTKPDGTLFPAQAPTT